MYLSQKRQICVNFIERAAAYPPPFAAGDILLIAKRGLYHERYKPLLSVRETSLFLKSRQVHAQEDEGKAGQDPGQKNDRKQENRLVVFVVVFLTGKRLVRIIDQLIENDVLHDVGHLLLAEADAGIPQADVLTVIFVRVIEIVFPLDIPALALSKKERVRQVIHIRFHSVGGNRILAAPLLPGVDGVRHPGGFGQRSH